MCSGKKIKHKRRFSHRLILNKRVGLDLKRDLDKKPISENSITEPIKI